MADKQLEDFVQKNAMKLQLPRGFHDDITQRMILEANWNDKPEILSSDQVEALAKQPGAVVLYRTNGDSYHNGKKARQFSDDFRHGDKFGTGGGGGQMYGGGLYFSDSLSGSKGYGSGIGKSDTIGAVLNKNAKVIDMRQLTGATGIAWVQAHPKAAKRMGLSIGTWQGRQYVDAKKKRGTQGSEECGYTSMAMAMGYNVVSNKLSRGETYYTVLNRGVLTTSTKDYYNANAMK